MPEFASQQYSQPLPTSLIEEQRGWHIIDGAIAYGNTPIVWYDLLCDVLLLVIDIDVFYNVLQ